MTILVTGAGGFVAQGLVAALHADGADLLLTDLFEGKGPGRWLPGDLADPAHLDALAAHPVEAVFHLASVPGALAERNPDLGRAVNLLAPEALFHRLAAHGNAPRVVFASSVAVYGSLSDGPVTEDRQPAPELGYGAHKWMTEILLADMTRRGVLDAVSLRLPGIVARPPSETGHGSAFMSQIFHKAAGAEAYVCPVRPTATCWWMSRAVCVANLVHAARIDPAGLETSRVVQLPVLHASVAEVLDALRQRFGADALAGISHAPDERIEGLFGRLPPLSAPNALAAGFVPDKDLKTLIENALAS